MNYFEIVRSYNEFLIAKQVGAKANSLFYALIGKCNTLRFPAKLTIYNSELRDLSGLSKDELNPARNKLTQIQVNDQYLVKYKSRGTRRPGDYWINYEGFTNYFQNEPGKDWSVNTTKDEPKKKTEKDYSDNPIKDGANYGANHGSNDGANSQRLIGKSDTLLTDCNEPNKTNIAAVVGPNFFDAYMLCFGRQPTPLLVDEITDYIDHDGISEKLVIMAFEKASKNGKGYPYARSILNSWVNKGIKTVDQAEEEQKKFLANRQQQRNGHHPEHQEVHPEWIDKQQDQPHEVTEEDRKRAAELDKYLSSI